MKLIEDLGKSKTVGDMHTRHRGIFECPTCLRHYTRIYSEGLSVVECKKCINHGETNTRLYHIWENMINRCSNDIRYKNVEVDVCWKSYIPFRNWALQNWYNETLSIDRINAYGNYTPANCRFTTQDIQCQNTKLLRSSNTSGYRGVCWDKGNNKWLAQCHTKGITTKIGRYSTAELAAKAYNEFVTANKLAHPLNVLTLLEII